MSASPPPPPPPPPPPQGEQAYVTIELSPGVEIVVDTALEEVFRARKWRLYTNNYGDEYIRSGSLFAHHLVVGRPPRGHVVRYVNGDHHDLRRSNLEITTQSRLQLHGRVRTNNTTGVRGVFKHGDLFVASIWIKGRRITTTYSTLDEARVWRQEREREA
jgi:hypothetical protein